MSNPIEISTIIPMGMKKEQALKLAEKIAKTMRAMWAAEGGPVKLTPKEFCSVALNYCRTPESKRFLGDKVTKIFSETEIEKIIESKNESVTLTFNGEQITINAKSPEPA